MIRKLRTQRDNQQWILDLALNMRGRVQNFERDESETPKRAHNYRMLSKMWREAAEQHEALARRAQANGFLATATEHYDHAIDAYRMAQHPIFYDDHPMKLRLYARLREMVDRRSECAAYPIERVEVPFEGKTISCLLHLLPEPRRAPCVIYIPGMDQTKEVIPRASHNIAIPRGFHVLAMDGPGQGNSNIKSSTPCARWRTRSRSTRSCRSPRSCGSSKTSSTRSGSCPASARSTVTSTCWTGSTRR